MVYTRARLKDALRAFRNIPNCRDRRALPSEKLASRLRSSRASAKVTRLGGVNWQAKPRGNSSDDDDYDPDKEKRLLATRRNKKKRKSDEVAAVNDPAQDRESKKLKGNSSTTSIHGDNTFYTIKLTSEKGRQFLRNINALGEVLRVGEGSLGIKPKAAPRSSKTYFDKYLSSDIVQDREVTGLDDQGLVDMDVDIQDEFTSNKHKVLRTGKAVEKPKKKKQSSKNKSRFTPPTSDDELQQHAIITKRSSDNPTPARNRVYLNDSDKAAAVTKSPSQSAYQSSCLRQEGTRTDPVVLDSDEEENTITTRCPARLQHGYGVSLLANRRSIAGPVIKQEAAPPLSPISLSRSPPLGSPTPYTAPTILTISTAFAHPLRLLSPTTPSTIASLECHFCLDQRMAVIGLGRNKVEVFTDPDNPLAYQEMGNGFRARGYPSTTICFGCIEKRIRMMRCHLKNKDSKKTLIGDDRAEDWGFEMMRVRARIGGINSNILYRKWLFPTPQEKKEGQEKASEPPLEPCSICPMPALWRCCKGVKIGANLGNRVEADLVLPIQRSMSGKREANPSKTSTSCKGKEGTPLRKPAANKEVMLISSDSEDALSGSVRKGTSLERQEQQKSQSLTKRPSLARPSTHVSQMPNAVNGTDQVDRGCGLKLCGNCKAIVVDRCHGVLDKRSVMAQFNNVPGERRSAVTGRADVEFLFRGSVADRYYEQQTKQKIGKIEGKE